MDIKSILCIYGGSAAELDALNAAMALGKSCSAQVRILHISPDPASYVRVYGGEIMLVGAIVTAIEKKNAEFLAAARAQASEYAARYQIPLDAPDMPGHHASAQFLHRTGIMETLISTEGRLSDLIVVSREVDAPGSYNDSVMSGAIFNTGRPVLVMPKTTGSQPRPWQDITIALAWDGSLEAARAMWGALPLMQKAENFHVLTAQRHEEAAEAGAAAGLIQYLKAHGVMTEIIAVDHGSRNAAEIILEQATELKCDLLIMGAYGHSRLREMILGGFTEYMLRNAGMPLLLSH